MLSWRNAERGRERDYWGNRNPKIEGPELIRKKRRLMRSFGAVFIEKEGLDLAVRRYILIQNSGVLFFFQEGYEWRRCNCWRAEWRQLCFKSLSESPIDIFFYFFFIGEYTIIIPSLTKSKCKNEASSLVLLGFGGLLHPWIVNGGGKDEKFQSHNRCMIICLSN